MTDRAIEMQPDEVRCMGVCVTDKKTVVTRHFRSRNKIHRN
jgi:hypothetical protein